MEFRLLGTLEADAGDGPVHLGRRRERLLLGILLLDAGKAVTVERLVDLLWTDNPAPAARATLHSHIARLRAVLAPHGVRIATRGPAYVAEVAPAAVDVHRFRHHVERARQLTDPRQRSTQLRHATSLWRGPLLADVADDRLRDRIGAGLADLFLVASEERAEAELECGDHERVALDLVSLAANHPTRERLVGLLMLAQYRSGRPADALAAYGRTRDALDEELGLRPGTDLAALHEQILRNDPALDAVSAPRPGHRRRFLPRDLPHFTGRTAQLATLDELAAPGHAAPAIVITAIAGTAGVGKTALAVHWCHRVADRFPDGQLYVDLRGYDRRRAEEPIDALAALLRTLGVPPEQVPAGLDEAAALFRSLLADRKVLLLLDNARSVEQVRPLLPAGPSCLVVVTSRDALNGLVARDGARRLDLELMTPAEAVELIGRIAGARRVASDGPAAAELAEFCGHLPIAIGIAAASLADDPAVTVRTFVEELRELGRLAALEISGDPLSSIRATFGHSVAAMPAATRQTFAMLGLTAGVRFDVEAVAALCDVTVEQAAARLDRLVEAHLVQEPSPGRYALHDLLRDYAGDLLRAAGDAEADERARRRLHHWYLGAGTDAAALLYPQMARLPIERGEADARRPAFEAPGAARAWLDAEWPNLVIWFRASAERSPRDAWRLADSLRGYLWLSRYDRQWHDMATVALGLAEAAGDLAAQGAARINLGDACVNLNDLPAAIAHYVAAAAASAAAGWPAGQASALHNLGALHVIRGELDAAEDQLREAIRLNRRIGRRLAEARSLSQLAVVAADRGRLAEATTLTEQALAIEIELDSPAGRLTDTLRLGLLRQLSGDFAGSESALTAALAIADDLGELRGRIEALSTLAALTADLAQTDRARAYADAALLIAHEMSDPGVEAPALTLSAMLRRRAGDLDGAERDQYAALSLAARVTDRHPKAVAFIELGRICLELGRPADALANAAQGNDIAREIGCRLIEADAMTVLARAHAALNRPAEGERGARHALDIYREAGCPVGEARALLALSVTTGITTYQREATAILDHLGIAGAASIR